MISFSTLAQAQAFYQLWRANLATAIRFSLATVLNAKENCDLNHAEAINVLHLDAQVGIESLLSAHHFSLILANINRTVHEKLLPTLARLSPNAKVLLSGLLKYDLDWLKKMLNEIDYQLLRLSEEGEWISALVQSNTLTHSHLDSHRHD